MHAYRDKESCPGVFVHFFVRRFIKHFIAFAVLALANQ
jgi:hypothetical protein